MVRDLNANELDIKIINVQQLLERIEKRLTKEGVNNQLQSLKINLKIFLTTIEKIPLGKIATKVFKYGPASAIGVALFQNLISQDQLFSIIPNNIEADQGLYYILSITGITAISTTLLWVSKKILNYLGHDELTLKPKASKGRLKFYPIQGKSATEISTQIRYHQLGDYELITNNLLTHLQKSNPEIFEDEIEIVYRLLNQYSLTTILLYIFAIGDLNMLENYQAFDGRVNQLNEYSNYILNKILQEKEIVRQQENIAFTNNISSIFPTSDPPNNIYYIHSTGTNNPTENKTHSLSFEQVINYILNRIDKTNKIAERNIKINQQKMNFYLQFNYTKNDNLRKKMMFKFYEAQNEYLKNKQIVLENANIKNNLTNWKGLYDTLIPEDKKNLLFSINFAEFLYTELSQTPLSSIMLCLYNGKLDALIRSSQFPQYREMIHNISRQTLDNIQMNNEQIIQNNQELFRNNILPQTQIYR